VGWDRREEGLGPIFKFFTKISKKERLVSGEEFHSFRGRRYRTKSSSRVKKEGVKLWKRSIGYLIW